MNKPKKTARLFFALWPTDQVRQSIVEIFSQLPRQIKGRVIRAQNVHITLHFIGSVTEANKDCMHAAAQAINAKAFRLDLDCFGHFPKAKIFWMGSQNTPAQLTQLHKKLGIAIEDCGFNSDLRPFLPHVTLLRKCSKSDFAQIEFSIPWFIDEFVLVESVTHQQGVEYQIIEKYLLV